MVFGIDGGTWDVMVPMIENGELPNFAKLYNTGTHGILRSRDPALSPVVWSTIFTGRLPADHGVLNWKTSQSRHRKVKAVWDIASEADLLTHVFNVPSTFPPVTIDGVMVSGFPVGGMTIGGNTGHVVRVSDLAAKTTPTHIRINAAMFKKAMKGLKVGDWGPWIDLTVKHRPGWTARLRIKRLTNKEYYISPAYRSDGRTVLTHPRGVLNLLDVEAGPAPYIAEGPGWSKYDAPHTANYLAEHLTEVAGIQTLGPRKFAGEPWNLFIYVHTLVDRVSHPYWSYMNADDYVGVDPVKAKAHGEAVRDAYRTMDQHLGEVLAQVTDEHYIVFASDHGFQSSRVKTRRIGTHHLDGIYLVAGPGIKAGEGEQANIEDIGPTVLHLLQLPVADDMRGQVIDSVREDLGRDVRTVASYESGGEPNDPRGTDLPVDEDTWEQLRGLGYVDGAAPRTSKD